MWKQKTVISVLILSLLVISTQQNSYQSNCVYCGDRCCTQEELSNSNNQYHQYYESQYSVDYPTHQLYQQQEPRNSANQAYSSQRYSIHDISQDNYRISPQSSFDNTYIEIKEFGKSKEVIDILKYLDSQFSTQIFLHTQLESVKYRQISPKKKSYIFSMKIPMINMPHLYYECQVQCVDNESFKIQRSHYKNQDEPIYADLIQQIQRIPFVKEIDQGIEDTIRNQFNVESLQLKMVDSSFPIFQFRYACEKGVIVVNLMFDILRDQVEITNMFVQQQEAQRDLKKQAQILKNDINEIRNRKILRKGQRYPQNSQNRSGQSYSSNQIKNDYTSLNGPYKIQVEQHPIQRIRTSQSSLSQNQDNYYQISPQIIQQTTEKRHFMNPAEPIIQQIKKNIPQYNIRINPQQLMQSVSSSTDPLLIPFLTQQYALNIEETDKLIELITSQVNLQLDSQLNIILANKNNYGIRLILDILRNNQDKHLFQAVINERTLQLLNWQEIESLEDIDSDVFNRFYQVDPSNTDFRILFSDQRLQGTIPQSVLSGSINYCQKKLSNDGIYYSLLSETVNKDNFEVTLLEKPEQDYLQVIQYEQINSRYNVDNQKVLQKVPVDDAFFNVSLDLVKQKAFNQIKGEDIVYLAENQDQNDNKYYRFLFNGLNGKNQIITQIDKKSLRKTFVKWAKLENGYVQLQKDLFQQLPGYNSFSSDINQFIEQFVDVKSINRIPKFKNIQVRRLPQIGTNYRLFYEDPFPFVLTAQQKLGGVNQILGMERIKTVPRSRYYNDKNFYGYKEVNIRRLRNSPKFASVFDSLVKNYPNYSWNSSSLVAGFKYSYPTQIVYKIVIKTEKHTLLAVFTYSKISKKFVIQSVDEFSIGNEPGSYLWKCDDADQKQGNCRRCQKKYQLTYGKCYERVSGCELQYGLDCYSCLKGYVLSGRQCLHKKENKISKTREEKRKIQKIGQHASTTLRKSQNLEISGNQYNIQRISGLSRDQYSDNCIKYKGQICSKCANRYYLLYGKCQRIQDSCSYYEDDGLCIKCFSGYYLTDRNECHKSDPLCRDSNSNGDCTACYKNYVLKNGKCFYKKQFQQDNYINYDEENELCEVWSADGKCLKCLGATYLNTYSNKCEIKDPFCQIFDDQKGICQICQRGYKIVDGKCSRKIR